MALRKKVRKFDSVICSTCVGTDAAGHYNHNYIESFHFVEKNNQNFRKENVITAIESLKALRESENLRDKSTSWCWKI